MKFQDFKQLKLSLLNKIANYQNIKTISFWLYKMCMERIIINSVKSQNQKEKNYHQHANGLTFLLEKIKLYCHKIKVIEGEIIRYQQLADESVETNIQDMPVDIVLKRTKEKGDLLEYEDTWNVVVNHKMKDGIRHMDEILDQDLIYYN